jgi:ribonuclease P protein component
MKATVKKSAEVQALFNSGEKIFTKSILALVLPRASSQETSTGRITVIAGKRLGTAPQRNRAKRRLREAAYLCKAPWYGFDVALLAREKVLHESFSELIKDMAIIAKTIYNKRNTEGTH